MYELNSDLKPREWNSNVLRKQDRYRSAASQAERNCFPSQLTSRPLILEMQATPPRPQRRYRQSSVIKVAVITFR